MQSLPKGKNWKLKKNIKLNLPIKVVFVSSSSSSSKLMQFANKVCTYHKDFTRPIKSFYLIHTKFIHKNIYLVIPPNDIIFVRVRRVEMSNSVTVSKQNIISTQYYYTFITSYILHEVRPISGKLGWYLTLPYSASHTWNLTFLYKFRPDSEKFPGENKLYQMKWANESLIWTRWWCHYASRIQILLYCLPSFLDTEPYPCNQKFLQKPWCDIHTFWSNFYMLRQLFVGSLELLADKYSRNYGSMKVWC